MLRHKAGDTLNITDGLGSFYEAVITSGDNRKCEFELTGERRPTQKNYRIHIGIAPTRNLDRTEWFVEKAVEIGADIISLVRCAHAERTTVKTDRLVKIAVSAMKQSIRASLPEIRPLAPFADVITTTNEAQRFIAGMGASDHLLQQATRGGTYCVLIGPEGDFSGEEIRAAQEANFQLAGLGDHRLRTETAALVATHVLQLVNL